MSTNLAKEYLVELYRRAMLSVSGGYLHLNQKTTLSEEHHEVPIQVISPHRPKFSRIQTQVKQTQQQSAPVLITQLDKATANNRKRELELKIRNITKQQESLRSKVGQLEKEKRQLCLQQSQHKNQSRNESQQELLYKQQQCKQFSIQMSRQRKQIEKQKQQRNDRSLEAVILKVKEVAQYDQQRLKEIKESRQYKIKMKIESIVQQKEVRQQNKIQSDKIIQEYKRNNESYLQQKKKQMKYIRDLERLTTEEDSRYNHSGLKSQGLGIGMGVGPPGLQDQLDIRRLGKQEQKQKYGQAGGSGVGPEACQVALGSISRSHAQLNHQIHFY